MNYRISTENKKNIYISLIFVSSEYKTADKIIFIYVKTDNFKINKQLKKVSQFCIASPQ